MWDSDNDIDLQSRALEAIPKLIRDNYLEWVDKMRSYLQLLKFWQCIQPNADNETPDDPVQLLMAAIIIRQTFSEPIRVRVQTSKDVGEDDGRSL